MSFGNYKRKHYIALVKSEDIPYLSDLKRLANKITTITDDSDEQTESSVFYDSLNGAGDEILLGRTESWSVSGQYDPKDPAHRIIANMRRKDDEERLVWHYIEETDGTFVLGLAKILNPVAGGGEAGDKEELSFRITFVKRPDVYNEMPDFPEKEVAKTPTDFKVTTSKKPYSKTQNLSWEHKEKILFTVYKNKERLFETMDKTYTDVLTVGEKATYYVTATNELGESKPTPEITAERIAPPKPTFEIVYEKGEVVLLIDSVYTTHEIYKNDVKIGTTDQEIFHDEDVKEGDTYSYFVKGIGEDFDDSESDAGEFNVPVTPPQKPQLELIEKTDTSIEIIIVNEEKNVAYTYYMNDQEVDSLTQTNLTPETTYVFKVCATKLTETVCSDELSVTTEKEIPKVSNLAYSITENPYEIDLSWDTTDERASYFVKNKTFEQEVTQTELAKISVENIKNTFFVTPKLDDLIGESVSIETYARPNPPKAEITVDDKTATITITDTQDNVSYIYKHVDEEVEIEDKKAVLELDTGTHTIDVFAIVEQGRSTATVLTTEILEDPIAVTEIEITSKTKDSFTIHFVKTNTDKYKVGIKETGFTDTITDDVYTFEGLDPNTTYTVFIVSIVGSKESEELTMEVTTDEDFGEVVEQGEWGTMYYVIYKDSEDYTTCVFGSGETGETAPPKANHLFFDGDVEKFNKKSIGDDDTCKKITMNKILDEKCGSLFDGSKNKEFDFTNVDTSNVAIMSYMFRGSQATTLDLSNFDTTNVTNMEYMFYNSQATTLDLSNFDTSNVTNMSYMFRGSQATTLDLSNVDTSNVTNMNSMFYNSQATTLDLSNFDTTKVTNMFMMFSSSEVTKIHIGEKFKFKGDHGLRGRWIKEDDPDVVFTSGNDWVENYDGTQHAGWYVKDTVQTLEWYGEDPEVEEQSNDTDA